MPTTNEGMGVPVGHAYGTPILGARNDALIDRTDADAKITAITVDAKGRLVVAPSGASLASTATMTRVAINAAASGDNTLVSGTASQTIRVHKLFLVVTSAVNIKFKDGTGGTDFHPALPLQAGAGMTLDFDGEPWFITTTALNLVLNLSSAVQVSGYLYYTKS